jgi:carbon monoxide dehydrogenase subunit G
MEMSGERLIAAPKEKIWAALNDPEVLKACIPGCETVEKLSDTEFTASAVLKLGPTAELFTGRMLLSDLDPPNGYTISGEGQGKTTGLAKGDTKISLREDAHGTLVSYALNAELGGAFAGHGTELIDSAAKTYADRFLNAFAALLTAPAPVPEHAAPVFHMAHEDHDHDPSNPHYFGLPVGVIIAAVIAAISVGITLAKFLL